MRPTVSFVIPHLGDSERRIKGLESCIQSIKQLHYPQGNIEILVLEGAATVPQKVKNGVEGTTGEWVCYMANDTVMAPDSLAIAIDAAERENKAVVAFHSEEVYPDEGNICAHFIIRRDFIPQLERGEVFSTDFWHVGCDNWLHAQAKKLDQFYHCNDAKIAHNHFTKGAEMDDVYQKGWSHVEEDRAKLKEKIDKLYGHTA